MVERYQDSQRGIIAVGEPYRAAYGEYQATQFEGSESVVCLPVGVIEECVRSGEWSPLSPS